MIAFDACGLERDHELAGVARAGRDRVDTFFDHHVDNLVDVGRQQHEVHTERLVGKRLGVADLTAQNVGRHVTRTDHAESAGVADGSRQLSGRCPRHAPLNDRILDPEQVGESGTKRHTARPPCSDGPKSIELSRRPR